MTLYFIWLQFDDSLYTNNFTRLRQRVKDLCLTLDTNIHYLHYTNT